ETALAMEGDGVLVLEPHRRDALLRAARPQTLEEIPVMRRRLEALLRGRPRHLLVEALQELPVASLEKQPGVLDRLRVLGVLHQAGAWTEALVELVEEARPRTRSVH